MFILGFIIGVIAAIVTMVLIVKCIIAYAEEEEKGGDRK